MTDLFQVVDDLDNDKQELVANRLEIRAAMPLFANIQKSYFDRLGLLSEKHIHELGCGTGAICRAVALDPAFKGEISGSDLSASLVNQARGFLSHLHSLVVTMCLKPSLIKYR